MPLPYHLIPRPRGRLSCWCTVRPEIVFGIYYEALDVGEGGLEERIAGGEGDAVVAAFENEVDLGEEGFHFGEAGGVVAEKVGAREGGEGGEGSAGNER